MSNPIQIKRGANASLPILNAGELGFSTDTHQVYIGDGAANHELAKAGVNTDITSLEEVTIKAINQTNAIENKSKLLQTEDIFSDYVVTSDGLLPATSATLTSDISKGNAYVTGTRVVKAVTPKTYTASVDTYVDISSAGVYTFVEVALGAAAPAVTADSIRLAKVVTDAAAITGVTDLRELKTSIAPVIVSPTLVTPALGTPASGVLTNCTGLPTAGLVDAAVTAAKIAGLSHVRATRDTAQAIATVTWTIIAYLTETYDTLGEFVNDATGRFTAKSAGYYHISGGCMSASVAWDAGEHWVVALYKNGINAVMGDRTVAQVAFTGYLPSYVATTVYLAAGDYIDIQIHHTQGASVDIIADAVYNYITIDRIL